MAAGIGFEETMRGPFALGCTHPERGARQGRSEGSEMAMHARITIPDLAAFLADDSHRGELVGQVDFAPLGLGIEASSGAFELFSKGPGDGREMVYEMAFSAGGRDYFVRGVKRVDNDPGLDLWRDTTTLFTTLYDGADTQGDVLGAGILSLGVTQLMAMLGTLAPRGDADLRTVATFGEFFFGELWTLYTPWVGDQHSARAGGTGRPHLDPGASAPGKPR
ncbi:hypothetical protein ACUN9Y_04705 [Halomonas sp. V046]|uniref:hypothetical protein n=1 Tax=Halomonas sp. V046 TaxID=3459611 RepID=UPI004043F49D